MKSRLLTILLTALIFAPPLSGCIFTNDTSEEIISEDNVSECPEGTEPGAPVMDASLSPDINCVPIVIDSDDDAVDSGDTIDDSTTEQDENDTTSTNETQDSTNDTEQENTPLPLAEQCLDSHQNLAMHIHPYINISVRGSQVVILSLIHI